MRGCLENPVATAPGTDLMLDLAEFLPRELIFDIARIQG
jgi:hypothetical protein